MPISKLGFWVPSLSPVWPLISSASGMISLAIKPSVAPQYFHLLESPFAVLVLRCRHPQSALHRRLRSDLSCPQQGQFPHPGLPFPIAAGPYTRQRRPLRPFPGFLPRSSSLASGCTQSLCRTPTSYGVPRPLRMDMRLPVSVSPHKGQHGVFQGRASPLLPLLSGYTPSPAILTL